MSVYDTAAITEPSSETKKLYTRIAWRLLPLLFISYIVAYLDRVNIGFAALRMQEDLNFSDVVYGLGAGIFFAGYVLFEVPSNLLLTKIGARKTIMRIMIGWGVVASLMMFVQTPAQFYVARFLLGVFEAGFFPGIILYLTYWFPARMRGSIIAIFMSAVGIAGVVGGPLSGWIMSHFEGVNGWHGWQWMFLLEGLPAVFLGLIAGFVLIDSPDKANWLSASERRQIAEDVKHPVADSGSHSMRDALRNPRLYALGGVYFSVICGIYILGFWLPGMIKGYGVADPFEIGLLTAIPYLAATIGMIVISRHSDKRGERRWHLATCMGISALALIVSTFFTTNLIIGLLCLTIVAIGTFAAMPLFWTIPTLYLSGTAAAGGIALINSIALIGGFVSPTVIGTIKSHTGNTDIGLYIFAGVLIAGAALLLMAMPARLLQTKR